MGEWVIRTPDAERLTPNAHHVRKRSASLLRLEPGDAGDTVFLAENGLVAVADSRFDADRLLARLRRAVADEGDDADVVPALGQAADLELRFLRIVRGEAPDPIHP